MSLAKKVLGHACNIEQEGIKVWLLPVLPQLARHYTARFLRFRLPRLHTAGCIGLGTPEVSIAPQTLYNFLMHSAIDPNVMANIVEKYRGLVHHDVEH